MCYSFEVSLITFIIGTFFTIINIILFGSNLLHLCINLFWYNGILLQLWETLIWKNYHCKLFTKLAQITNVLQPLAPLIILLIPNYIKNNNINTSYIGFLSIFYLLVVIRYFNKDYGCIKKNNGISLEWWDFKGAILYGITSLLILKLLLSYKNI